MNIKDQIRAEIERMREINKKAFMAEHISADVLHGRIQAINHLFAFLDSLPEQPVPTITKSNALFDKCVENCDPAVMRAVSDNVDKMLGSQPVEGLEEEYQEFCKDNPFPWSSQYVNREYIDELCLSVARHFAEWGMNQCPLPEDTTIFLKGVAEGKRLMMDEAVEHYVIGEIAGSPVGPAIVHYDESLNIGDKVKVIVIKEDK